MWEKTFGIPHSFDYSMRDFVIYFQKEVLVVFEINEKIALLHNFYTWNLYRNHVLYNLQL